MVRLSLADSVVSPPLTYCQQHHKLLAATYLSKSIQTQRHSLSCLRVGKRAIHCVSAMVFFVLFCCVYFWFDLTSFCYLLCLITPTPPPLFLCLSLSLCLCLSTVFLSVCLPACLSVCLSVSVSLSLSLSLYLCLSVCLYFCLSFSLSLAPPIYWRKTYMNV